MAVPHPGLLLAVKVPTAGVRTGVDELVVHGVAMLHPIVDPVTASHFHLATLKWLCNPCHLRKMELAAQNLTISPRI